MTSVHANMSSISRSHSRDSNTAGAPLPHLPRRMSSTSRAPPRQTSSPSHTPAPAPPAPQPPVVTVVPPTPPHRAPAPNDEEETGDAGSASSSSSGSESRITVSSRPHRIRGQRTSAPAAPDAQRAIPFPSERPPKAAVPKRISSPLQNVAPINKRTPTLSETMFADALVAPVHSVGKVTRPSHKQTQSMIVTSVSTSGLPIAHIRKKSGEPLKSSLKSRVAAARGDLSVVLPIAMSSKSAPTTPSLGKAVHFDAQLEHVKLFIAQQKPSAVSRDGSPTDTSGTDSDWPKFIFGQGVSEEERARKSLAMKVVNMPAGPRIAEDVVIEEFVLAPDATCANGRIRVRNLAFEKWVAVRFTFDEWQTTSEITAKYLDSTEAGTYDRFTFSIRLSDMMARIEEKTLYLAVRYTVAGREIWDNNRGENYQVKFEKKQPPRQVRKRSSFTMSDEEVESLKGKLEEVVRLSDGGEAAGNVSPRPTPAPAPAPAKPADPFSFKSDPLSTRYDFANSAKVPWRPTSPAHGVRPRIQHARTASATSTSSFGFSTGPAHIPARKVLADVFGRPPKASPRDWDEDGEPRLPIPYDHSDDDRPFRLPVRRTSQRGYFDIAPAPSPPPSSTTPQSFGFPRSPSGAPRGVASPSGMVRFNSFPRSAKETSPSSSSVSTPVPPPSATVACPVPKPAVLLRPGWSGSLVLPFGGSSEDSTPSITSESSQSSRENSPTPSPGAFVEFLDHVSETPASPVDDQYSAFVNRFCFFTGGLAVPEIQRSHSASSVEEYLSTTPHGTPREFHDTWLPAQPAPQRTNSFDSIVTVNGSTTPSLQ